MPVATVTPAADLDGVGAVQLATLSRCIVPFDGLLRGRLAAGPLFRLLERICHVNLALIKCRSDAHPERDLDLKPIAISSHQNDTTLPNLLPFENHLNAFVARHTDHQFFAIRPRFFGSDFVSSSYCSLSRGL